MRVALLTNLIPPYHKPLYLLLAQAFDFRLFLSCGTEPNRPWQPDWKGLPVVLQKGISFPHQAGALHFPLDTLSQLSRFHPDVVISAEMGFRTLLALIYARRNAGARLLIWSEVTARTEENCGGVRRALRRFLVQRADGFLALGPGGCDYLKSLGASSEGIFQIAYCTNPSAFEARPQSRANPNSIRLLYSGQLIERKGLVPFLKELARWANEHPEQQFEFTLVGEGPERSKLAALKLPRNIELHFAGNVDYERLPGFYSEADLFVLPTLADTWAVVVNEALLSGIPVLGSRYSQAVEALVTDGINGWRFRPDVCGEMAAAIERAFQAGPEQWERMRADCRAAGESVTPQKTLEIMQRAMHTITRRT